MHIITITPNTLNHSNESKASFLLHRLLAEHKGTIPPGSYYFDDEQTTLVLPFSLHPITNANNHQLSHYQINNNENERIYSFSTGICYYESITPNSKVKTDDLFDFNIKLSKKYKEDIDTLCQAEYKQLNFGVPFDTPITLDLLALRCALDNVNSYSEHTPEQKLRSEFSQLMAIKKRLDFFAASLKDMRERWEAEEISANILLDDTNGPFYRRLIQSAPQLYAYFQNVPYLFQGKQVIFSEGFVLRDRSKEKGRVVDILKKEPMVVAERTKVYEIDAMWEMQPKANQKLKPKHRSLYKFDFKKGNDIGMMQEFEKTQRLSPDLHAKNFHFGFFRMRYMGDDLLSFFDKLASLYQAEEGMPISQAYHRDYIKHFLLLGRVLYEALASLHPDECHGDIKPENILIGDCLTLIDFSNNYTGRYAAPETIENSFITPKGDVYSAARTLAVCLGDKHRIFEMNDLNEIFNILKNEPPKMLLGFVKQKIDFFVANELLTKSIANDLESLLLKLHAYAPCDRPIAKEAAEAFKSLHERCFAYYASQAQLPARLRMASSL